MRRRRAKEKPLPVRLERITRRRLLSFVTAALAIGITLGFGLAALLDLQDGDRRPPPPPPAKKLRAAEASVARALEKTRKQVPSASTTPSQLRIHGPATTGSMGGFLTAVFHNVRAYWTRTLRGRGKEPPSVTYRWIAPGARVPTPCHGGAAIAGDRALLYCPADNRIYVGETMAVEVRQGVASGFLGQDAGFGRAVGDFGVAYIVAHEYGHAIQRALDNRRDLNPATVKPFELQADCMAGLWANSAYRQGLLDPGDVDNALSTARAAGDFEHTKPSHHGTPDERRGAWQLGYATGDPEVCNSYLRF